jgi:group I intron endonuclease
MIIYKATCTISNKCYIGQTIKPLIDRQAEHYSSMKRLSNTHFHNALRKHGIESFKWIILAIPSSFNMMNVLEELYVEKYNSFHNGYNMTEGGGGVCGWHHTEESRQKISEAHIGKKHTKETKQKISDLNTGNIPWNKGKTGIYSKETRRRLSEIARNRPPMTEETKRKIGEGNNGKIVSIETRKKLSDARKNYTHSEETRRKMSEARKGKAPWNKGNRNGKKQS